jgi:uncharacterized protein YggU (UPF0235/DUF167 family)
MLIHVKIHPDAGKDEVVEKSEVSYIVFVRAKAERNEANLRMKQVLAEYLKILPESIRIITGHHSPSKIVEILKG